MRERPSCRFAGLALVLALVVTATAAQKIAKQPLSSAGKMEAWAFLQKHRLPADPKYKEYIITK
jgi:hypothetical protein